MSRSLPRFLTSKTYADRFARRKQGIVEGEDRRSMKLPYKPAYVEWDGQALKKRDGGVEDVKENEQNAEDSLY